MDAQLTLACARLRTTTLPMPPHPTPPPSHPQVHVITEPGAAEAAAAVKADPSGAYPAQPVFGFTMAPAAAPAQ